MGSFQKGNWGKELRKQAYTGKRTQQEKIRKMILHQRHHLEGETEAAGILSREDFSLPG